MYRIPNIVVLVAILLVGGGLVLVGVLRVREAASQIECVNHLKVLGFSVHNYADQLGRFPSATVPEKSLPPERRLSWLVEMPPYVEAGPRLPFDKTKPWDAEENMPHWYRYQDKEGQQTENYLGDYPYWFCPSNPNQAAPGTPSLTHYVGIAGLGREAASRPIDGPDIGFFGYDRLLRHKDFMRGPSDTLMVVETRLDNGPWTAGGYPTVRGLDPDGPPYLGKDGQFGGTHRGGVNTLFADASVRFLSEDTSPRVFAEMAKVAGGDSPAER
jgi:prepilin-type processing-associated H-X9-DG protein